MSIKKPEYTSLENYSEDIKQQKITKFSETILLFSLLKGFSIYGSSTFTILKQLNEQSTILNFVGSFRDFFSFKFKTLKVTLSVRGQHRTTLNPKTGSS